MSVLQTERFYPNLTTRHPKLNQLGRHLGTTTLAAACTLCAISAGLAATATITLALANSLPATLYTPILANATWRLGKWTWALARIIKART